MEVPASTSTIRVLKLLLLGMLESPPSLEEYIIHFRLLMFYSAELMQFFFFVYGGRDYLMFMNKFMKLKQRSKVRKFLFTE